MPREVSNEGEKKQMENFQSNSSSHIEVMPFQAKELRRMKPPIVRNSAPLRSR